MGSQEVSCKAVWPLIEYARLRSGPDAGEALLCDSGLAHMLPTSLDPGRRISFTDFLTLLAALRDTTGDLDAPYQAGRTAAGILFNSLAPKPVDTLDEAVARLIDLVNGELCAATHLSPLIVHRGHAAIRVAYMGNHIPSQGFGQFLLGLFAKATERHCSGDARARLVESSPKADIPYQVINLTWQAPLTRKREMALASIAAGGLSYGVSSFLRSCGHKQVNPTITTVFGMALGACLGYQSQTQRYVRGLLRTSEEQNKLLVEQTHMLEETIAKNRKITSQAIEALAQAIEAKDPYTCGHSRRVAEYSRVLALAMALPTTKQDVLFTGALLHDIGKIGVPDSVLLKEGKLTAPEFQLVKQHTVIGYDMLLGMEFLDDALGVVRHHHERWDGAGYPNGLAGDDIPPLARIVGLADAFDAMTSNRTYRRRLNYPEIRNEIELGRGRQFAPDVVDAFFAHEDFFAPMAPS